MESEMELPPVTQLGYDDVKTIFTLDDVIERLFPKKRLFNSFVGYRCLEGNIKHLVGPNKAVFATVLSPTQGANELKDAYHDIDMITFANWWVGEAGLIYCIGIYAADVQNESSCIAHLQRHIKTVSGLKLAERGILITPLGDNVSAEKVKQHMRLCGVDTVLEDVETMQVYFEKEIK